jgi:hypothetical protein
MHATVRQAGAQRRLGFGVLACAVLGLAAVPGCHERNGEGMKVYADTDWYVARPEREEVWRGVLREHTAPLGPGTRGGLTYVLVTREGELQVYAPHAERLTRFLGHRVSARGKLVDLRAEGFGRELWIGSITEGGS